MQLRNDIIDILSASYVKPYTQIKLIIQVEIENMEKCAAKNVKSKDARV